MNETAATAPKPRSETADFLLFLVKLAIFFFILRSFIVSPFNIPSESMQPRLVVGDYLLVSKWSYGYSRYSMPFNLPLIPGRIMASQPDHGDVVVFKAPPEANTDYIKRVIGLPGDTVQMRDGDLWLNGKQVQREQVADFIIPVSPNTRCYDRSFQIEGPQGSAVCSYPRFRETLPNGKSYYILDLIDAPRDDTEVITVPQGHMFLMGDNRDNSLDSRFPAIDGQGIGIVPQEFLVGRALVSIFSTDGSASLFLPWTWFTAARWDRIGEGF
ncbi:signal peptidase I [Blastomonas sp.]|uniref:signal peptidase I n=1 Tax=Blastomonas sp. TaxID=1909299 RepID=UPI0035948091